MGKKRKHLSHEEVWDDSALVNSWNDALDEYKLYHSIHAKGERVEDVIKHHEEQDTGLNGLNGHQFSDTQEVALDEELEDGEWVDGTETGTAPDPSSEAISADKETGSATTGGQRAMLGDSQVPTSSMPIPAPFPSGIEDQALKNLMMSWYWSGYYTGFYQGQQQAHAKPNAND